MSEPQPSSTPTDGQIYERVLSAILDHRLQPGTRLAENKLAAAFGVSRTRVRPVLVRLANEQVVRLTHNRGATVSQPTEREAHEVFQVRRMIEPSLVERFIAHANPSDMQRLGECLSDEVQARAAGDVRKAIRLSGEFHLLIAGGADHETLGRILRELISRTSLILMAYSPSLRGHREAASVCGCFEHRSLLNAIVRRDAAEAAALMRAHLQQLEDRLQYATVDECTQDLCALFGTVA